MKQFNELGLSDQALEAVARLGYEAPTPVQEQAIPLALEGRDLIAAAKTGTAQTGGKVSNGVFVAFAPYDDPQIAVAIVIEKGGSGAALASTAVQVLNAYFSNTSASSAITGENTLLG